MAAMADDDPALKEVLLASALESLNIEDYWPAYDSKAELDLFDEDNDGEYPVILCFYENLLDYMLSRSLVQEGSVKTAIERLIFNYGRVSGGKTPEDLDYDDLNSCYGYLHRYAVCHTALVRNVMVKLFHTSPPTPIRRLLTFKSDLEVVSLGGGPGNDFVGFCSALYGKHYGFLSLSITIVDKMSGWERVFFDTERMLRERKYGNASSLFTEVAVSTCYVRADLRVRSGWSDVMNVKMRNADIVLLVKVVSVVPDSEKASILQNVVLSMKPGALLIFIDCPFPKKEFEDLDKFLELVYSTDKERFHFNYEVKRFNYTNITSSQALVRVYSRKFQT